MTCVCESVLKCTSGERQLALLVGDFWAQDKHFGCHASVDEVSRYVRCESFRVCTATMASSVHIFDGGLYHLCYRNWT